MAGDTTQVKRKLIFLFLYRLETPQDKRKLIILFPYWLETPHRIDSKASAPPASHMLTLFLFRYLKLFLTFVGPSLARGRPVRGGLEVGRPSLILDTPLTSMLPCCGSWLIGCLISGRDTPTFI